MDQDAHQRGLDHRSPRQPLRCCPYHPVVERAWSAPPWNSLVLLLASAFRLDRFSTLIPANSVGTNSSSHRWFAISCVISTVLGTYVMEIAATLLLSPINARTLTPPRRKIKSCRHFSRRYLFRSERTYMREH